MGADAIPMGATPEEDAANWQAKTQTRTKFETAKAKGDISGYPGQDVADRAARLAIQPPTFAQKITGAVEAGINAATMLVGGAIGMPLGAAGTVLGVSGHPNNLEKGMEAGAAGVGGALKRMLTGPMDLNQPQGPDSDVGAEYTESVNAAMGDLQPLIGHAGGVGVDFPNMQTATRAAGDLYRAKGAPAARAAVGPKVMGALELAEVSDRRAARSGDREREVLQARRASRGRRAAGEFQALVESDCLYPQPDRDVEPRGNEGRSAVPGYVRHRDATLWRRHRRDHRAHADPRAPSRAPAR
jgi:hypothetical protein